MRIVLSGYYGFDNVGDEAILFSIIKSLKNENPEVRITVLSNNPEATKQTYHVDAVNRWKLKEIRNVLKQADGLISGGGSLLQDETGIKSIPYYAGIIKIAKWYKKPVFVYAQGMGPIKRRLSKWIVRNALNKVGKITVRDEGSKTLLQKIGVKKQSVVVPDPVLALDRNSFSNNWIKSQAIDKPIITVSVRDWPTDNPYKEKIAHCLDKLVQKGNSIVFIPMHGKIDEVTSMETAGIMTEKSFTAPADSSIEERISIIGESQLLIGMRLHALIFSAVTYTPFVALSYDPKIDAFAAICNQPVIGHVENNNWSGESLFDAVLETLSNETLVQSSLENKVKNHQKEALKTPKMALELFTK
ncbi:polysaccharide pyruvyl transferase CsaB [Virgibacillus sp. DJP39]|uniref:polysaccharide pyruvyl transferase CsaB n=1 Tax=Virgibacillus sp. DJP39 TaxID=3409790 RepID=UPI003BB7779B